MVRFDCAFWTPVVLGLLIHTSALAAGSSASSPTLSFGSSVPSMPSTPTSAPLSYGNTSSPTTTGYTGKSSDYSVGTPVKSTSPSSSSSITYPTASQNGFNDDDDDDDKSVNSSNTGGASNNLNTAPTSFVLGVVTGLKNATMTAVNAAGAAANRTVNAAYEVVKPHVDAYQLGVRSANSYSSSIDTVKERMDWQRGFFIGVADSYMMNHIDPSIQVMPQGPMQLATQNSSDPDAQHYVQTIDQMFRAGEIDVALPGLFTDSQLNDLVGTSVTNRLTPIQKFGLEQTVLIIGENVDMRRIDPIATADTAAFTVLELSPNGTTVVVVNRSGADYETVVPHELQHAGDVAIVNHSLANLDNPDLSQADRSTLRQAGVVVNEQLFQSMNTLGATSVEPQGSRQEYLQRVIELRAYINQGDQGAHWKEWAEEIYQLTPTEADQVYRELSTSPTLEDIDKTMNAAFDIIQGLGN